MGALSDYCEDVYSTMSTELMASLQKHCIERVNGDAFNIKYYSVSGILVSSKELQ